MSEEKKPQTVSVPQWLITGIIPVIITVGGWVWTASALTTRVNAQEDSTKILFAKVNQAEDLAKRHDAIIPIMQKDITEIKGDVKQILLAVRREP